MSGKTLNSNDVKINKKKIHASKKPIVLSLVDINRIVISDRFKYGNENFKYFIGYAEDNIIRPLCVVLPQMSGYIKYFDNCGKSMSFIIEHDSVFIKNNEIWDRIKGLMSEKFHRKSIYGEKYTKTKVKTFTGVVHAIFLFDKISKEGIQYTGIALKNIDSVIKVNNKYYRKCI